MYTLEELNTVFMRKGDACKKLGLTNYQMGQLIFAAKLATPKLAGSTHLYSADVQRLVGTKLVEQIRGITGPSVAPLESVPSEVQA